MLHQHGLAGVGTLIVSSARSTSASKSLKTTFRAESAGGAAMSTKAIRQRYTLRARELRREYALASLVLVAGAACGESSNTVGPALPGSIQLSTETSGFQKDDSYELLVDGVSQGIIGANDQMTVSDLDPATYEVTLGDVAANCTVESTTVEVASEQTASVSLTVSCTYASTDEYVLRFTRDRPNLDDGTLTDCIFGICPSGENEWDFYAHYNSQTTPRAVIRQNQSTAVEIAHLPGAVFEELTEQQVAAATFTTSLVPDPFDGGRVILIKTNEGAIFALGNPVENEMAQTLTLEAALLQP
jgi:hypothetical protein